MNDISLRGLERLSFPKSFVGNPQDVGTRTRTDCRVAPHIGGHLDVLRVLLQEMPAQELERSRQCATRIHIFGEKERLDGKKGSPRTAPVPGPSSLGLGRRARTGKMVRVEPATIRSLAAGKPIPPALQAFVCVHSYACQGTQRNGIQAAAVCLLRRRIRGLLWEDHFLKHILAALPDPFIGNREPHLSQKGQNPRLRDRLGARGRIATTGLLAIALWPPGAAAEPRTILILPGKNLLRAAAAVNASPEFLHRLGLGIRFQDVFVDKILDRQRCISQEPADTFIDLAITQKQKITFTATYSAARICSRFSRA